MMTWARIVLAAAGLSGAAGVALAAAGAHVGGDNLNTAAMFLLLHAAAAAGLARPPAPAGVLLPASVLIAGSVLFSGDLALRALAETKLFAMAAPTGGTVMIAGWLLLALAAAFGRINKA